MYTVLYTVWPRSCTGHYFHSRGGGWSCGSSGGDRHGGGAGCGCGGGGGAAGGDIMVTEVMVTAL